MRILLVDGAWPDEWAFSGNRFRRLADVLRMAGHDVTLINVTSKADPQLGGDAIQVNPDGGEPLFTGLGRAIGAGPLIRAHRLREQVADTQVDLVISPLRGGLSQGLLMDRACGEGFRTTRFALWWDGLSLTRSVDENDARMTMANLVADALERQCISMSDALIEPRSFTDGELRPPPETIPHFSTSLPVEPAQRSGTYNDGLGIREIVFAGPLGQSAGLADFVHAVERLSAAHRFRVVFAVPAKPLLAGVGKEWLGRVASTWRFPFRVVECTSLMAAKALVTRRDQLGFTMVNEGREPELFSCDGPLETGVTEEAQRPAQRIEKQLATILGGRGRFRCRVDDGDWPVIVEKVQRLPAPQPLRPETVAGATVCVLHFNRPSKLAQALASVPRSTPDRPIELLVIDNASTLQGIDIVIADLIAGRDDARLLRLDNALPQAAAYNRGVSEAHHDVVIFLDDDNVFQPDGVERLVAGLHHGNFDILVTNLDVFDDQDSGPGTTAGCMAFLGAAHSAGLFFNGFGDTAMAVKRDAFTGIGGFYDAGRNYPCLDWVTLATAQSQGLRIGVLQRPAVRYRRSSTAAAMSANKINQREARALVLAATKTAIGNPLVAGYAQTLHEADS